MISTSDSSVSRIQGMPTAAEREAEGASLEDLALQAGGQHDEFVQARPKRTAPATR